MYSINCVWTKSLKPAAHERTCRAYLLFVTSWSTKFPRVRATFTAFSSFVTCEPNIQHVWHFSSFVTKKFSCAASKRQARLNRKICACVQLAELKTRHELVILTKNIKHVWYLVYMSRMTKMPQRLPAHEEILSIQLVTNNKYARQVRSCAAGFILLDIYIWSINFYHYKLYIYTQCFLYIN
jgi:hypothetical protein